jgi:hypothetical protein
MPYGALVTDAIIGLYLSLVNPFFATSRRAAGFTKEPTVTTSLDLSRYAPLRKAARRYDIPEAALRWHAQRVPGLAVRRLGRIYVDLDRLAEIAAPRPLAK